MQYSRKTGQCLDDSADQCASQASLPSLLFIRSCADRVQLAGTRHVRRRMGSPATCAAGTGIPLIFRGAAAKVAGLERPQVVPMTGRPELNGEFQQGYLWNAALHAKRSVRNYGFFLDIDRYFPQVPASARIPRSPLSPTLAGSSQVGAAISQATRTRQRC